MESEGAPDSRSTSSQHSPRKLNLDPHFHTLALDGLNVENGRGELVFRHVPQPGDAEVARVADRVHRSVARLVEKRGLGPQADPAEDGLSHDEPLLAELYGASVSGRIATGPRVGRRLELRRRLLR